MLRYVASLILLCHPYLLLILCYFLLSLPFLFCLFIISVACKKWGGGLMYLEMKGSSCIIDKNIFLCLKRLFFLKKLLTGGSYALWYVSTHLIVGIVSTNAFLQLCFWSTESWEKRKSVTIQLPAGKVPVGDTRVQFHTDQIRLLVCHETQLAVYDASKMERSRQVRDVT